MAKLNDQELKMKASNKKRDKASKQVNKQTKNQEKERKKLNKNTGKLIVETLPLWGDIDEVEGGIHP